MQSKASFNIWYALAMLLALLALQSMWSQTTRIEQIP